MHVMNRGIHLPAGTSSNALALNRSALPISLYVVAAARQNNQTLVGCGDCRNKRAQSQRRTKMSPKKTKKKQPPDLEANSNWTRQLFQVEMFSFDSVMESSSQIMDFWVVFISDIGQQAFSFTEPKLGSVLLQCMLPCGTERMAGRNKPLKNVVPVYGKWLPVFFFLFFFLLLLFSPFCWHIMSTIWLINGATTMDSGGKWWMLAAWLHFEECLGACAVSKYIQGYL